MESSLLAAMANMTDCGDHQQLHPEARKKLSALINCAICLGTLRAPVKILGCGHSYCYRCLVGVKESNGQQQRALAAVGRRFIRCPTCRQESLLPRGQVRLLPNNYVLQQLLAAVNPNVDDSQFNEEIEVFEEPSLTTEMSSGAYALLIGDVGALEAIVSMMASTTTATTSRSDWYCPSCNYYNYAFRAYCRWCPSPSPPLRPRIEIGYIDDAAIFDQIQLLASVTSSGG